MEKRFSKTKRSAQILFIALSVLVSACGHKAKGKKFPNATTQFKPTVQDTAIDRNSISGISAQALLQQPPGALYAANTEEMFEVAEMLLELAALEKNEARKAKLEGLSEAIHNAFYSNPENFTSFDQNSTAYLELALGLAYEGPENIKGIVEKNLDKQVSTLGKALVNIKFSLAPRQGRPNIKGTMGEYEAFLVGIPSVLARSGVEKRVVDEINKRLNSEYLPLFKSARAKIERVNGNNAPEVNVKLLEDSLKSISILPPAVVEGMSRDIRPAKELALKIRAIRNADQLFDVLFDIWNNPLVKRDKIRKANPDLHGFFNSMTPEQMEWLRKYNKDIDKMRQSSWWKQYILGWDAIWQIAKESMCDFSADPAILVAKLEIAKGIVVYKGLDSTITDLRTHMNEAILSEVDSKMRGASSLIVKMVVENIAKAVGDQVSYMRANLMEVLRTEGRAAMKEMIFKSVPSLVAIEDSRAALFADKDNRLMTRRQIDTSSKVSVDENSVITSARTIGLALALQSRRLGMFDERKDLTRTSNAFFGEIFGPLNKMMSVVGYKYMENDRPRFPGLSRMIEGKGPQHEMDINSFDKETGFFTVPDQVVVAKDFTVDTAATAALGLNSSVSGNAEMIRGASMMANYLKDWQQNAFDATLGSLSYQDIKVFPKPPMYSLGLGVSSVPLRNLMKDGLVALNQSGAQHEGRDYSLEVDPHAKDCPLLSNADPIMAVALTQVSPSGRGDIVRTADIARFVLATNVFLSATDGFENTQAPLLVKEEDGVKPRMKTLECGRKSLKQLMIGMANFLTSKMQAKDGGFAHQYSLKEKKILPELVVSQTTGKPESIERRYLEDQLLAIQALRVVYDTWRGEAYRNLAIEGYYFLNAKMFDSKTGFYRSVEGQSNSKTSLKLMALTLKTLTRLEPILPAASQDQVRYLNSQWASKLEEFSSSFVP